ncbi:MAG: hypothetical protein M3Q08_08505 [Pseudomonadota bacterium]|jgi:hypothetical protein|nr:hypothetical protein [Pseudomonadota bacterium]
MAMKPLSDLERYILMSLAKAMQDEERANLSRDIEQVYVEERSGRFDSVIFGIRGYDRPPYEGQKPYSAEAAIRDSDGADLWAIAYMDQNRRLLELEIIRWDEKEIIQPDPSSLAVSINGGDPEPITPKRNSQVE